MVTLAVTVIRSATPAATCDAFLLPERENHRLGAVVADLAGVAEPLLFVVGGGCLIVPRAAQTFARSGLIRLRRVAEHHYIPLDAELSPALLPDELAGLTRGSGLVHLASGCFAFDPNSPVPPERWLKLPPRRFDDWRPFPVPSAIPDSLRKIERPAEPDAVLEVLGGGEPTGRDPLPSHGSNEPSNEPIADAARPPKSSPLKHLAGRTALGAAGMLAWLGKQFAAGGLSRAAANLAKRAVEAVPRLSEQMIGKQEAALRELLRQLQSGDAEQALKRAPIAVGDPNQPSKTATDASLAERSTSYSFSELFRSTGITSAWVGGGDVWLHLQTEYRRLANEAVARGDYRRAAYLLGVLLRDLRGAANVLTTGGRHRDAALLYRDRLNDPLAAATAFDSAGDFDEAVRLYEKAGADVQAGDLLRRIGDEPRAEGCYRTAAAKLSAKHENRKAGELVVQKLGDAAAARTYFRLGWQGSHSDAIPCAQRLIDDYLLLADEAAFDGLIDEAASRLQPPAHADAGRFFNHVLHNAAGLLPEERVADLRDRVRLLFAEHVRTRGSGTIDPLFAGVPRVWQASVRRDAAVAAKQGKPQANAAKPKPLVQGTVRAVIYAQASGVVFIATSDEVVCWNLQLDTTTTVAHARNGENIALATDRHGDTLFILSHHTAQLRLTEFALRGSTNTPNRAVASADIPYESLESFYLQPRTFDDPALSFLVLAVNGMRQRFHSHVLVAGAGSGFSDDLGRLHWIGEECGLLWDWSDGLLAGYRRLDRKGGPQSWAVARSDRPGWTPATFGGRAVLDVGSYGGSTLDLVGIDVEGVLHRNEVTVTGTLIESRHVSATHPAGYRAACLLHGNRLAAATGDQRIEILRAYDRKLAVYGSPMILESTAPVVFLGHYTPSHELFVILADGTRVRLPQPG